MGVGPAQRMPGSVKGLLALSPSCVCKGPVALFVVCCRMRPCLYARKGVQVEVKCFARLLPCMCYRVLFRASGCAV